ncbi:MAG: PEP-CTERM sorting domain-containing protein [Candidatus Competibacteraceae bacterium]
MCTSRRLFFLVSALVLWVLTPGNAAANHLDLITNGGFETGDFTGWTVNPLPMSAGGTGYTDVGSVYVHSGTYAALIGEPGFDGTLSQTLTTLPGVVYDLEFWLASGGDTPNDFSVRWNGALRYIGINLSAFDYTRFAFQVIGTGSDVLEFAARNDSGFFNLDDVSLLQVPEPASAWLVGLGVILLGAMRCFHRDRTGVSAKSSTESIELVGGIWT